MSTERSLAASVWRALRPQQWVKNVLVFGGLAFTGRWHAATSDVVIHSERVTGWWAVGYVLAAFAIFSMLSSAGYLVNDIRDREADARHPRKRLRPIASGAVSVPVAAWLAVVLFVVALAGAGLLSRRGGDTVRFFDTAVAYAVLTNLYSFLLKRYVIVDVLTLAILFVLRAAAGCYVIPEPPSNWLVVCTFFGALFIGLCKRRAELVTANEVGDTREVLTKYQTDEAHAAYLLDQMIQTAATATILTYSLYTFYRPGELHVEHEQGGLMLTIPFVVYGVFRYLYLVHKRDIGQNPERLFGDRPMLLCLACWAVAILVVTSARNL